MEQVIPLNRRKLRMSLQVVVTQDHKLVLYHHGDLRSHIDEPFVKFSFRRHTIFTRIEDNLYYTVILLYNLQIVGEYLHRLCATFCV